MPSKESISCVPSKALPRNSRTALWERAEQVLGRALFQKGQVTEALQLWDGEGPGSSQFRGYAYATHGRRAEAQQSGLLLSDAVQRLHSPGHAGRV
jgi:hypothetical protein